MEVKSPCPYDLLLLLVRLLDEDHHQVVDGDDDG
jgi:hypothetical protein